jgi:thymidylate synthase (FAD)
MKIVPIASTHMHDRDVDEETPYRRHDFGHNYMSPSVRGADELAELAGRNCYLSWKRPNPATATNQGYLKNILSQNHHSVLEHSSVTFYCEGVSRSLLAELTRHRHLSFSVVSQRYVDGTELEFVSPPIIGELKGLTALGAMNEIIDSYEHSQEKYTNLVEIFTEAGYKKKEAREAARAVLPNMMDSPLVVTGNLRAWRDVLGKRYHIAADREIQGFATEILKSLRMIAPNSFQDIPEEKYV